ncbi:hypothetical protein N0V90_013197 [Kalmusia sp. IMI 367209]|nr:hypothetical protein N0V90_013197 [Kalmusia sp. IMI 367209]
MTVDLRTAAWQIPGPQISQPPAPEVFLSPSTSLFQVHATNAARLEQADENIAAKVELLGHDDSKTDVLRLVYYWLDEEKNGRWLMVLDNAYDGRLFSSTSVAHRAEDTCEAASLDSFPPQCLDVWILVTSRDMVAAVNLMVTTRNSYLELFCGSAENQAHLIKSGEVGDLRRDGSASDAVITT